MAASLKDEMRALQGKTIVIAGGSGFVGISLATHLTEEHGADVVILSRSQPKARGRWRHQAWDGRNVAAWSEVLEGAHGLVNLAGRTVDCIKTPAIGTRFCDPAWRARRRSGTRSERSTQRRRSGCR
ncbi:MAG: hypothetical protein AAGA81_15300 [Acidobacteriota bacterium]